MGHYCNGRLATTLGWITTAIMAAAGVYGVSATVTGGV